MSRLLHPSGAAVLEEGFEVKAHGERLDAGQGVVVDGTGGQGIVGRDLIGVDEDDIVNLHTDIGPGLEKGEADVAEMVFAEDIVFGKTVYDGCEAGRGEEEPAQHCYPDNDKGQQGSHGDEGYFPTFFHGATKFVFVYTN